MLIMHYVCVFICKLKYYTYWPKNVHEEYIGSDKSWFRSKRQLSITTAIFLQTFTAPVNADCF
jgi:hypothetical protein